MPTLAEVARRSYPNGYKTTFKDENGTWKRKCKVCGETKTLNSRNFSPNGKGKDAFGLRSRMCYCRPCVRKIQRDIYARKMQDPEWKAKRAERVQRNLDAWREKNPEKYMEQHRRAMARRKKRLETEPEFRDEFLSRRREEGRVLRLKRGLPVREKYVGTTNAVIPIGPFREWLQAVIAREPDAPNGGRGLKADGRKALAGRLGTTDRSLYRLLNEGQPYVSVALADRAIHAYDSVVEVQGKAIVTFDDLYGPKVPLEVPPQEAAERFGNSYDGSVLPDDALY